MKIKKHTIQVPIYLYVEVTEEEMNKQDFDFFIESKVIEKYKTFNDEFHLSVDRLMFEDWEIYETRFED